MVVREEGSRRQGILREQGNILREQETGHSKRGRGQKRDSSFQRFSLVPISQKCKSRFSATDKTRLFRGVLWFQVHKNMGQGVVFFESRDIGDVDGWGSDAMTSDSDTEMQAGQILKFGHTSTLWQKTLSF